MQLRKWGLVLRSINATARGVVTAEMVTAAMVAALLPEAVRGDPTAGIWNSATGMVRDG
jgi:hypothetical protein